MTILFRGKGANHGITGVSLLLDKVLPTLETAPPLSFQEHTPSLSLQDIVNAYEQEVIHRAVPAVLTSRRAALDAHDYQMITEQSLLVSKRVIVTKEQGKGLITMKLVEIGARPTRESFRLRFCQFFARSNKCT